MRNGLEAVTANEAWYAILDRFRVEENVLHQQGRGGPTIEMLHVLITIGKSRQRWIPSRWPVMNPAFAVVEVVWVMSGRRDSAFLNHWNPILPKYAGSEEVYHGAYGFRLRHHFSLDQLERAYHTLMNNPDSRQVVLQIWDSSIDFPDANGRPKSDDIPCNVCAFLKIRNGRLEWTQVLRSNDFFRGFPYNIVQFTSLQEIMAGWLGVKPGPYYHFADSLHIYEKDLSKLFSSSLVVALENSDSLCLPKIQSESVFTELAHRLETMAFSKVTSKELIAICEWRGAPKGYENLLRVAGADHARRQGWLTVGDNLMQGCTNPALTQVWERWVRRSSVRSNAVPNR
jgi:thymidylate synthase